MLYFYYYSQQNFKSGIYELRCLLSSCAEETPFPWIKPGDPLLDSKETPEHEAVEI